MRILIIGLGSIALKHISVIRKIDVNCEIFALRSQTSSKSQEGVINLYSFDEVEEHKFDFVIVSNPTSKHKCAIEQVIRLRVPIFIEKPISNTLEIQNTVVEVERSNILTYVACNLRFLESIQFVKTNLDMSLINEVNVYCGSFLPDWRPSVDFRTSYSAKKDLGGGVHIDLIHEIDYIYWLFGKPERVTKVLRNVSSLQIDAIDYANYCLEYKNFCVNIILNYYRRDYKRTLEILFANCTWNIDLQENNVLSGEINLLKSNQRIKDTYLPQMQYFYNLLNTSEKISMNSIQDAFQILKIVV